MRVASVSAWIVALTAALGVVSAGDDTKPGSSFLFRDVAEERGLYPHVAGMRGHGAGWGEASLFAPSSTAVLSEAPCLLGDLWAEDNTPGARIAMRFAASKTAAAPWNQGGTYAWNPAWDANTRHSGGINVAYADGHAKWMKADKMRENLTRPRN